MAKLHFCLSIQTVIVSVLGYRTPCLQKKWRWYIVVTPDKIVFLLLLRMLLHITPRVSNSEYCLNNFYEQIPCNIHFLLRNISTVNKKEHFGCVVYHVLLWDKPIVTFKWDEYHVLLWCPLLCCLEKLRRVTHWNLSETWMCRSSYFKLRPIFTYIAYKLCCR